MLTLHFSFFPIGVFHGSNHDCLLGRAVRDSYRRGRFNDANPRLLDRRQLRIAISNDGRTFSQIAMLVDDPTKQRFPGLLKAHGWQYPCALVDEDRLLVAYSVNKEDLECGIVPLKALADD